MGADAIMEYQYSVIATIRDILWGGKKAASRPEYLTIIIILGIEHGKSYLNSEAGTMAALLPTYSHMESFFCVLSLFLAQRLPHPLLFYIAGSPEV